MRPLIVGQAPGPNTDPAEPLSGRCGARLADLCGLDLPDFLNMFERVNLIRRFPGKAGKGDRFPIAKARSGAIEILLFQPGDAPMVLLGNNVWRAFGFPSSSGLPFVWTFCGENKRRVAFAPHPSSVSHFWNDPAKVVAARRFWRALALDAIEGALRP